MWILLLIRPRRVGCHWTSANLGRYWHDTLKDGKPLFTEANAESYGECWWAALQRQADHLDSGRGSQH